MSSVQSISSTLSLPPQATGVASTVLGVPTSYRSSEILQGQKTVEISHNGSIYRLQATRLGKLILTK